MDVLVSGSGGTIGSALVERLKGEGHHVIRLARPASNYEDDVVRWSPTDGDIEANLIEGLDAVVHLAGEPLLGRWTESKKRRIRDSRVLGTRLLAETLAGLDRPPSVMLSGSAVGWYGDRGEEVLTEDSGSGTGFLAQVCQEWELATKPASDAGVRVCHLRTAPVMDRENDLIKLQLWAFKLGLGAKIGNGQQWFPWIDTDDHVLAQLFLLEHEDASGPFNFVSPNPVRNQAFADTLAEVVNRPRFLFVPTAAIAAVFGKTAADQMVAVSQRVVPARLEQRGFGFEHPQLDEALRAAL